MLNASVVIVDPELKEECVINGRMTITMNIHKELCGIQKSGMQLLLVLSVKNIFCVITIFFVIVVITCILGGNAIMSASVVRCSKIAAVKTAELTELMNQTLEDHWNSRKR